jgi:AAHS family 4-hydroxybenzoate transporter-like MFS transporter
VPADASPLLDVERTLDSARFGRLHVTLFVVSLAVMILEGIDIQLIGFVAPVIIREWGLASGDFGWVFSAGLAGAMVGAVIFGALGDRIGRRAMILASLAAFGVGTLVTPWVTDLPSLVALRFLTSLGLGGVVPNILALCAEWFPGRVRASLVGTVATGQLMGGVVGSLASSWLLPQMGWPFMFLLAGALSVLMLVPAALLLPESLRFLIVRGDAPERIAALLARLGVAAAPAEQFVIRDRQPVRKGVPDLFRDGRAGLTTCLWLAIGFNVYMTAFVIYWLPTLLTQAGVPLATAILTVTAINAAGIAGGIVLSTLVNRFSAYAVLGSAYLLSAVAVVGIGIAAPDVPAVIALAIVAGALSLGAFAGINMLSASLYPTELRSAGVGAVIAASKGGGIVGPAAAGLGLAAGLPLVGVFGIAAAGGVCAGAAIFALAASRGASPSTAARS